MAIIAIPRILRERLTDDGAEALVDMINKADKKSRDDVLLFVGDRIENRFVAFEYKYDSRFEAFEQQFESKINVVEQKFEKRLAEFKADIIKWMFVFVFGQFWAIIGVLFIFFRK